MIFKYSPSIVDFYKQAFMFYLDFIASVPVFTLVLSGIFSVLLYIFWFYYFQVYFHRLPQAKDSEAGWWGILGAVLTFLGFGCVACGETLLTSLLLFFLGSTTTFAAHVVGNASIILGIAILSYGLYKNYKLLHNENICAI